MGRQKKNLKMQINRAESKLAADEIKRRLAQSRRDKQLANGQKTKQVAKQFGERQLERAVSRGARADNQYLKCLLNPEQYGPCSYPDMFGDRTTLGKFILNRSLYIDNDGNFEAWVSPTLPDHVWTTRAAPISTTQTYTMTSEYANKDASPQQGQFQPWKISTTASRAPGYSNFVAEDTSDAIQCLPDTTGNTLGNYYFPFPSNVSSATLATANYGQAGGFQTWDIVGGNVTVEWVDLAGTATTIPQTQAATAITFVGGGGYVRLSLSAGKGYVKSMSFQLVVTYGATTGQAVDTSYSVTDYEDLYCNGEGQGVYEEYRVVAMSALVTFQGDTLYNGGQITARFVEGGEDPDALGWYDYDQLASVPGSYEGPLMTGCYMVWKPTDTQDMEFRKPIATNDGGILPSLLVLGRARNPTNAVVRLRTCMIVEAKTFKSYIPILPSRVCLEEIEAATRALQGFPMITENPLHVAAVKDFLRGVVRKGAALTATARELWQNPTTQALWSAGTKYALPAMAALL